MASLVRRGFDGERITDGLGLIPVNGQMSVGAVVDTVHFAVRTNTKALGIHATIETTIAAARVLFSRICHFLYFF